MGRDSTSLPSRSHHQPLQLHTWLGFEFAQTATRSRSCSFVGRKCNSSFLLTSTSFVRLLDESTKTTINHCPSLRALFDQISVAASSVNSRSRSVSRAFAQEPVSISALVQHIPKTLLPQTPPPKQQPRTTTHHPRALRVHASTLPTLSPSAACPAAPPSPPAPNSALERHASASYLHHLLGFVAAVH